MGLQPNPTEPTAAAATSALARDEGTTTMLAEDINQHQTIVVPVTCGTCSAYGTERVAVPVSVIMDLVVDPQSDLTGIKLADKTVSDPRITSTTAASPEPSRPSRHWTTQRLLTVAQDLRVQRRIPFSPFASHVEEDGLRDRADFLEFRDRYLADLPESSTLTPAPAPEAVEAQPAVLEVAEEEEAVDPLEGYDPSWNVGDTNTWIGDYPSRALAVEQVELSRPDGGRKGVLEHINKVLEG